jgi:Ni,Fe-hydrogenase III small subunit/Pyruvate/2-oxoacid:ferredoxin oxidoreductase delta subunit
MPIWTLIGLAKGVATTDWPRTGGDAGQAGGVGMPHLEPERCTPECRVCADVCPTRAITVETARAHAHIALDYGRCIACQWCVEACPDDALQASHDWAFGVRDRNDLRTAGGEEDLFATSAARSLQRRIERSFKRSLHIRHVDAGSCNGCESELQALNNPFYNLHRLGIFFTASPRFADLLLVTGPVTRAMREPLRAAWEAMPEPKRVLACGTCAVSGGIAEDGYACGSGLNGVLPVDLWLPGCPPNPAAIIEGLLVLLDRIPQRVREGRIQESAS